MSDNPETLRTYARIFRMPRRVGPNGEMAPPTEMCLAAADALEYRADHMDRFIPLDKLVDGITPENRRPET